MITQTSLGDYAHMSFVQFLVGFICVSLFAMISIMLFDRIMTK